MQRSVIIAEMQAEARRALISSIVATSVVGVIVAAVNFGQAFAAVEGLTFSSLDSVVVVGRQGNGVGFWPMLFLSVTVFVGLVGTLTFRRYRAISQRAARLVPVIEHGTEDAAKVVDVRKSHEKRGNMSYERLTLVVEGARGRREAFKEVTIGTALPAVQVNAEASVLSHGGATVIVVGRDVFDA